MAAIPICTFHLLIVFVVVQIPSTTPRIVPTSEEDALMLQRFEEWIDEIKPQYKNDAEKAARFKIFKSNVEFIDSFNRNGTHKFKLGINHYTDLTNEEFNDMLGKQEPPEPIFGTRFRYENETDVPGGIDWHANGAVTGAWYQGRCGACWAFAAVAAVESINMIQKGYLDDLSVQQILDCIPGNGCKGGKAWWAFNYVINNDGLTTYDDYPYVGTDNDECQTSKTDNKWSTITDYEHVPSYDEDALKRAVANQPVYASLRVGSNEFKFFSGDGVFNGNCGNTDMHAVLVVGYGVEEDGTKFWRVKNSWGVKWGKRGFGKIARETGIGPKGVCSITLRPIYPTLVV